MPKLSFPYIDYDSQFLVTMTPEHHARQLGQAFVWQFESVALINVGASVYVEIIPPTTGFDEIAWKPSVVSTDQLFKSELFEAPTVTDGTTPCLITNQDRTVVNPANTVIYSNPTAISGGTLLRTRYVGTGTNAKPTGLGNETGDLGWTLDATKKYVIKYTNVGQQATTFFMVNGQFFEINRNPNWQKQLKDRGI